MSEITPEGSAEKQPRRITLPEDPDERVGLFRALYERSLLGWKLFWDDRVNLFLKSIPVLSVAYLISPIDLIPQYLLVPLLGPGAVVGSVDDLALVLVALNLFIEMAPPDVVMEHLREMGAKIASQFGRRHGDDVVEGEAEYIDE